MNTGVVISSAATQTGLNLGANTTNNYSWIQSASVNNSDTYRPLVFQQNGGNVGIGTTSPQNILHVAGGNIQGLRIESSSNAAIIDFYNGLTANTNNRNWRISINHNAQGNFDIFNSSSQSGAPSANAILSIDKDGNLGIGDIAPTEGKLVVGDGGGGNIYATFATANTETLCWDASGASLITDCTSLSKFKENVVPLSLPGIETILALSPREYDWVDKEEEIRHDLGFVAEEVEAVSPLLASYSIRENGVELNGVKYERMSALFVKAIQELDVKITQFASNNGQWSVDDQGKLVVKELETEKLKIAGTQTVGYGTIKQGDLAVTINAPAVKNTSQIFVTFRDDLAGRTDYISSINDGSNFTVKLSGNLPYDVHFSWWILDSEQSYDDYLSSLIPEAQAAEQPPSDETATSTPDIVGESSTTTATTTP